MKTPFISLALASVLALHAGVSSAQAAAGPTAAEVVQLDLVNKLIALGDARKDPLLLLAAASLQKSLGSDGITLPAKSTAPADVLDRAKALAAGRKDLLGLADELTTVAPKGPSWRIDAVTGRSSYRY
jgi:hypothetical protein